jgi:hypothetical protein
MLFLLRYWKVGLGLAVVFSIVMYLESKVDQAKTILELETKTEQQDEYINTRKSIDDAGENVRGVDADAALEWLRNRQNSNQ